jgi:hypothetical protein
MAATCEIREPCGGPRGASSVPARRTTTRHLECGDSSPLSRRGLVPGQGAFSARTVLRRTALRQDVHAAILDGDKSPALDSHLAIHEDPHRADVLVTYDERGELDEQSRRRAFFLNGASAADA